MAIPAMAIAWAREAQAQTGASDLAAALALAIAGPESGYNPSAVGDNGSSFGLTQLHNNNLGDGGGLGNGYPESVLLHPAQNLAIAMRYIQSRLDAGATPYEAISPWSTRDAAMAGLPDAAAALGASVAAPPAGAGADGLVLLALAALVIIALVEG
ncbi:MAG: transglycosylase SLT domain-containing protein [Sphingomonadaceae bacterium]